MALVSLGTEGHFLSPSPHGGLTSLFKEAEIDPSGPSLCGGAYYQSVAFLTTDLEMGF